MPPTSRRSCGAYWIFRPRSASSSRKRPGRPSSSAGAGRGSRSACSNPSTTKVIAPMGDTQKLTPDEQIRTAREAFENGEDFTLAVEEEFAVLDPETLSLTNRFEELQSAAEGTALEQHL